MKKIFNLLFISLAVALYSSCTPEEEDLFDDSSANRIEATLKADKEVNHGHGNIQAILHYMHNGNQLPIQ